MLCNKWKHQEDGFTETEELIMKFILYLIFVFDNFLLNSNGNNGLSHSGAWHLPAWRKHLPSLNTVC